MLIMLIAVRLTRNSALLYRVLHWAAGKAMVYTAAAGLQPHHVLPIQVDVGCNTAEVRDHPLYMGLQQVCVCTPESKPTTTTFCSFKLYCNFPPDQWTVLGSWPSMHISLRVFASDLSSLRELLAA